MKSSLFLPTSSLFFKFSSKSLHKAMPLEIELRESAETPSNVLLMSSTNNVSRCGGGAPVAAPGDRLRWLRQVACSGELSPGFMDEELYAWTGLREGVLRQMGVSDAVQLDSMQSQASTVCSFSSSTLSPALGSASGTSLSAGLHDSSHSTSSACTFPFSSHPTSGESSTVTSRSLASTVTAQLTFQVLMSQRLESVHRDDVDLDGAAIIAQPTARPLPLAPRTGSTSPHHHGRAHKQHHHPYQRHLAGAPREHTYRADVGARLQGEEEAKQQSGQLRGIQPVWFAGAELSPMNVGTGVGPPWRTAPVLVEARPSHSRAHGATVESIEGRDKDHDHLQEDDAGLNVGPGDPFALRRARQVYRECVFIDGKNTARTADGSYRTSRSSLGP
jgi:hypothetical protein